MSQSFWDKRSQAYEKKALEHGPRYQRRLDWLRSRFGKEDEILEVGCATGEVALDFAPHVKSVHAIDSSEKMIAMARQKAENRKVSNLRFEASTIASEDLRPGAYSAVLAFNVLHLLDDVPGDLVRMNELLKPGGWLVSQTPCLGEWNPLLRFLIGLAQRVGWAPSINPFTISKLETLVTRSGFEIHEMVVWAKKEAMLWIVGKKAQLRI